MPSLASSSTRFEVQFKILDGGSGVFKGIITEPGQGDVPSYQFNFPRRVLRTSPTLPIRDRMVIQDPSGHVFLVAGHGPSQSQDEIHFNSYRLFQMTGRFTWQRRNKGIDVVTGLPKDSGLGSMPQIWGAYEPSPEQFDRGLRSNFEEARFITNALIKADDVVNGMKVSRVDTLLGVSIATLG